MDLMDLIDGLAAYNGVVGSLFRARCSVLLLIMINFISCFRFLFGILPRGFFLTFFTLFVRNLLA